MLKFTKTNLSDIRKIYLQMTQILQTKNYIICIQGIFSNTLQLVNKPVYKSTELDLSKATVFPSCSDKNAKNH